VGRRQGIRRLRGEPREDHPRRRQLRRDYRVGHLQLILADYFASLDEPPQLDSVASIFSAWNTLHGALKEHYYLQAGEDKEEDLESSRMDVLIANPRGIFGVAAHRTVQEFSRFYAYGSGSPYALGAMYAAYRAPSLDAEAVARLGVMAAAEFHDETGLPIQSFVMDLNRLFNQFGSRSNHAEF